MLYAWFVALATYTYCFTPQINKMSNQFWNSVHNTLPSTLISKVDSKFLMSDPKTQIEVCSSDQAIGTVAKAWIDPDPPAKGTNLTLNVVGNMNAPVSADAYLIAKINKGGFRFPRMKVAACDYLKNGCPIEKGPVDLQMSFEIPKLMPGGSYEVEATLYNPVQAKMPNRYAFKGEILDEAQEVLCLQGTVVF